MVRVFRWSLLVCAVVALMSGSAIAQVTNGEVIGKVTDQTNAAVPGVTVTLESPALQQPMVTVSQASGAYRFVQVPIGTYTITFTLPGFKTVKRAGIIVETGFSAEVNTKLEVSTREEVVNVTAASPVVDTKSTTTGAAFNRETLDTVPTARDPWVVLNMVPGVMLSGVNVGGSASGQQLTPTVRGAGSSNNMWNMEGASTTDMAATGASAVYYDFDSFAEIQVTTGGSDASIQTGGLNINLISKSGSNVFKGTFSGAYEDDNMQSRNITRDLYYGGGSTTTPLTGTPMIKNYEYGGDAGGPIVRNRLWYWGAARKNLINNTVVGFFKTTPECTPVPNSFDAIKDTIRCMNPDWTELVNYNAKFNYQLNAANRFQFLMQFADKIRNARDASTTRPPETAYHQNAWYSYGTPTYNFKHTWVLTDKLVFDNGVNFTGGGFYLDFQDPERQWTIQPFFDDVTNIWTRSYQRSVQGPRANREIKTDSSYFWSNLLGGDHQVKFGVRYKSWNSGLGQHWGGNAIAQYDDIDGEATTACSETRTTNCYGNSLSPELVRMFRDSNTLSESWTYGAYLQDNYSRGRLRLNVGVRYDFQDGKTAGTCVPASLFAPEQLPPFCWDGSDTTGSFKDIAPRLSGTYDLLGTGKTVLKGTFAMYFDQGNLISNLGGNPAGAVELQAPWNDANGDRFVQLNEVDMSQLRVAAGNFDLTTGLPRNITSPNIVDPDVWNGRTREAIATVSHELMDNFGIDVSYIYRKDDHDNFTPRIGETADMWVRREWPNASTTAAQIAGIPAGLPTSGWIYYEIAPGVVRPADAGHTMRSNEYAIYKGWEISARKRMSNRWMMNASLTWNDRRLYNALGNGPDDEDVFDLTNQNMINDFNSQVRYVVKFNGALQLPKNFTLSQNTIIQEGNNRAISFNAPVCRSAGLLTTGASAGCLETGSNPTIAFRAEPTGTTHLPATMLTDLALSKQFRFARGRAISFDVTMFNIFNVNTIRGFSSSNLSQATFTRVSSIVPPRVVRVFARLQF
jgi:hypothetical protein